MADEIKGEVEPELEAEDYEEQEHGEGSLRTFSPSASLVSDFCKDEEHPEEEELGEAKWVCEPIPPEGEFASEEYRSYLEDQLGEEEEDLEEVSLEEKRSLDSEYLKSVLGTPLTFALLDIAMKRPTDPIQYLGVYLLNWRWCLEDKAKYEEKMKNLNIEREAYNEKIREKERQKMLEEEEKEEELRRGEREESTLDDDDDYDDLGETHELEAEDR